MTPTPPSPTVPAPPAAGGAERAHVPRGRGETRRALGWVASLGLLLVVVLLSLRVGSVPLSTGTVLDAFTAFDGSSEHLIVRTLRLPRTVLGLAVGASLAVAGVALQAVTRNALASPTILGVNAGASFAVVTAVFALGVVSPSMYVWFAFLGALLSSLLVLAIASAGRGGATPVKLALAGAVVTALLTSWTSGLMVLNERTLEEVRFGLAGSVAGRDLDVLVQVAPFLVVGMLLALGLTRQFDALGLGEAVATGLGQRTGLVRATTLVTVVLLAGASVAAAGPIGFVGLAVPHAVRTVVGPRHRWLIPYAAVYGPVLLLGSDILGRIVMRPSEIQVGIVTAIVGAPFLVHLVRRRSVELA